MQDNLNLKDYKNLVISVLDDLDLKTDAFVNLILGTTATESEFGKYRRQIGFEHKSGGGYGINQIELATYYYLMRNFLKNKPELKNKIMHWYDSNMTDENNLILNDSYNIAICRLKYYSCEHLFDMPKDANNIEELAKIWKKYYNTIIGKGTIEGFIDAYNKYILGYKLFG